MQDAREKLEAWQHDYNHHRPHSSLGHLTPSEFVKDRSDQQFGKPPDSSLKVTGYGGNVSLVLHLELATVFGSRLRCLRFTDRDVAAQRPFSNVVLACKPDAFFLLRVIDKFS